MECVTKAAAAQNYLLKLTPRLQSSVCDGYTGKLASYCTMHYSILLYQMHGDLRTTTSKNSLVLALPLQAKTHTLRKSAQNLSTIIVTVSTLESREHVEVDKAYLKPLYTTKQQK